MFFKKTMPELVLNMRKNQETYENAVTNILKNIKTNIENDYIPIIDIAKSLGFEIFSASFTDSTITSILFRSSKFVNALNRKNAIVINKDFSAELQFFSIAHEIGHLVLHCPLNNNTDFLEKYRHSRDRKYLEEIDRQADLFAEVLLMPRFKLENLLKKQVVQNLDSEKICFLIVEMFFVPEYISRRRLSDLKMIN